MSNMRETQQKTYKKKPSERTHIKIKLRILTNLRKLPMSQYELSRATNSDYKAIGKALIYLENLGKVEKVALNVYDSNTKENKLLWRIRKE